MVFLMEIVRSPRGMRLLRQPMDNATSTSAAVIVHAVGVRYIPNRILSLKATVFYQLPEKNFHRKLFSAREP